MKLLSKTCAVGASCPAVYDMEDGSGDLLIVGRNAPKAAAEAGIDWAEYETPVRISRDLLKQALETESS